MTERPQNAIASADRLPAQNPSDARNYVLGWANDDAVALSEIPIVVWRADDKWWAGLPGRYTDLKYHEWEITHWTPIDGVTYGEDRTPFMIHVGLDGRPHSATIARYVNLMGDKATTRLIYTWWQEIISDEGA